MFTTFYLVHNKCNPVDFMSLCDALTFESQNAYISVNKSLFSNTDAEKWVRFMKFDDNTACTRNSKWKKNVT